MSLKFFQALFLSLIFASMKKLVFIVSIFSICIACHSKVQYQPDTCFSKAEQDTLLYHIVRLSDKLPPQSNHETKFDGKFNSYYHQVAADYQFKSCFKDNDFYFLLITRPARSITPMREAIGIKLKIRTDNTINDYEEIFRTWKMPEPALEKKYPILFEKMVAGESLEEFYPKNAGDQFIEFPDDRFYFDKTSRRWRDRILDSLNANQPIN